MAEDNRLPVFDLWPRSSSDDWTRALARLRTLRPTEDTFKREQVIAESAFREAHGLNPTSSGLLQERRGLFSEGGDSHREQYQFREGNAMEGDNQVCEGGGDGEDDGHVSETVHPILQNTYVYPSIQLEATGRGFTARMVVRAYGNREVEERLGEISGSLCQTFEQVVGRLSGAGRCCHRRVGTEERMYGIEIENLGRQIPISSRDQGGDDRTSTTTEDYSYEQLYDQGMFSK